MASVVISLRLSEEQLSQLREEALAQDRSVSQLIRWKLFPKIPYRLAQEGFPLAPPPDRKPPEPAAGIKERPSPWDIKYPKK